MAARRQGGGKGSAPGYSPGADHLDTPQDREAAQIGIDPSRCRYSLSFRDPETGLIRRSLQEASSYPFHEAKPFRHYAAHRLQRHMPGSYWFATTGRQIAYESRLELSVLLMLDYELAVDAVAAQPFCLHARTESGGQLDHVPDFFVLLADGRGRVVDVTPAEYRSVPKRAAKFQLTAAACRLAGWEYRLESEPDSVLLSNLRALSGFRREPVDLDRFAPALIRACADPRPIGALSAEVGPPALVRPVLFHLLWRHRLVADLGVRLNDETLVETRQARA